MHLQSHVHCHLHKYEGVIHTQLQELDADAFDLNVTTSTLPTLFA